MGFLQAFISCLCSSSVYCRRQRP